MQKGDNLDQAKIWQDQLNHTSAGPIDQFRSVHTLLKKGVWI